MSRVRLSSQHIRIEYGMYTCIPLNYHEITYINDVISWYKTIKALIPEKAYFWGTHNGAELDRLIVLYSGDKVYPLAEGIEAVPLAHLADPIRIKDLIGSNSCKSGVRHPTKRGSTQSTQQGLMSKDEDGVQLMPPIKLDHCVIHVSDWESSNSFYRDVLGAKLLKVGAGWSYRFGKTQLNCHRPNVQGISYV